MSRPPGRNSGKRSGAGSGRASDSGTGRASGKGPDRSSSRSAGSPRSVGPSGGRGPGSVSKRDDRRPDGRPGRSSGKSGAATGAKGLGGRQVEGRHAVRELLMADRRKVHEVWITSELEGDPGVADIAEIAVARRIPLHYVGRAKLDHEARSEAPQGVLAHAAEIAEADLGTLIRGTAKAKPFLVAVDGVTDPGNLGAIIRNCDGAGVTGLLLPRHRAVHITPTVAKASAGAIEHVPMVLVPGLPATLRNLKDHGVWTIGLDDDADRDLYDIAALAVESVCVVLGAEGAGLARLTRERCDTVVSIPMLGRVSSLNVAAAAAVALYEVTRARRVAS